MREQLPSINTKNYALWLREKKPPFAISLEINLIFQL